MSLQIFINASNCTRNGTIRSGCGALPANLYPPIKTRRSEAGAALYPSAHSIGSKETESRNWRNIAGE